MTLIIGVYAHKQSHTAVAVERTTAEVVDERQVVARDRGHAELLQWASGLDADRVWGLEDCRSLSGSLEIALLQAGELVIRVPPKMMSAHRKAARSYGKSAPIDALAVARAVFHEPNMPLATLPGIEQEIGLLVDHRNNIVTMDFPSVRWRVAGRAGSHLLPPAPNSYDICVASQISHDLLGWRDYG